MNCDAIVVGAGPNGLAAAVELARAGLSVMVREAAEGPGGAARTEELILPGFRNDVCSSVHPLGAGSPFFRSLPLARHGLAWAEPPVQLAHPLDDGRIALLERSPTATAPSLAGDGDRWVGALRPFVENADALMEDVLAPLRWPPHPVLMARFGLKGLRSVAGLAHSLFRDAPARALLAGMAAHSGTPLDMSPTGALGLVLAIAAHGYGWPFARGGSEAIVGALVAELRARGGVLECSAPVRTLQELPRARAVLLDVTPRQLLEIAGPTLDGRYARALRRYRYGVGVFKVDWALDGPIPWNDPRLATAGTIHLGGTLAELSAGEAAVWAGHVPDRPFTIVAQPSIADPTRAPPGKHVAWAYCHVPNGSDRDMTGVIETELERLAPGFRDLVLGRHVLGPAKLQRHDANLVGGDIAGGAVTLRQLFFRPAIRANPYRTPLDGVYLCSSSTPPGGGVHGMCGYHAARTALKDLGIRKDGAARR